MGRVDDVAAAILRRISPLDTWKLQKLVYYCQAWHLVWEARPLFPDRIEAWASGPVVPNLYKRHRGMFQVSSWEWGDSTNLDDDEASTIEVVLASYGHLTGGQLRLLTHQEDPWKIARVGLGPGERSNRAIKLEDMAEYYSGVADAEEASYVDEL